MFTLQNQLCKITSVTNVSEKHGKDRVPAISVGLYMVGPGTWLDQFDSALRGMLYRKPMPAPGDLPLEAEELSELRFPFMRNFSWDRTWAGYILRIYVGATGAEDILLGECKIKDIRLVTQEGGSVGINMKVTAHPKDEHDHGWLGRHIQHEVIIDLTPPDKPVDLFSTADDEDDADGLRDPFEGSDLAQDESRIE